MLAKLIIDGVEYEVPDEDEWELGELAEVTRLQEMYGTVGVTIATVWIAVKRKKLGFTVQEAMKVKIKHLEEREPDPVSPTQAGTPPAPATPGDAANGSPGSEPERSGTQPTPVSTASTPGT